MSELNTAQSSPASGPIFVVGLSRSGTKLLRNILNRHSRIGIPDRESYFIPHALNHFGGRGKAPDAASRRKFIRYFQHSVFCRNMTAQGKPLPADTLAKLVGTGQTWPAIIDALFRYYVGAADEHFIWGDKTPKYLNHMGLLKAHFPHARLLHIYRDPRDRVMSAHEAWGANFYIGAQQWREAMQRALDRGAQLGDAYKAVSYEQLVTAPALVVADICAFLGLGYEPGMLELESPVETRGDPNHPTRRGAAIFAANIERYRSGMSARQLSRVEEIVFPFAARLGYCPATTAPRHRPLSLVERLVYSPSHYLGNLRVLTSRWGVIRGLGYALARWRL